jgi:hypothetical protein
VGNSGVDILIAGTTAFDHNQPALAAMVRDEGDHLNTHDRAFQSPKLRRSVCAPADVPLHGIADHIRKGDEP